MRVAIASFIAAITLFLGGQVLAVEKKPCGPGEQEVIAKDRTTMCVKAYGVRPKSNHRLAYHVTPSAPGATGTKE